MTDLNGDVTHSLARWIAGPVPQHALLVEGPWGSGKTHLVHEVLSRQSDGAFVYVSLYGVQSVEEFERAIVRAQWPASQSGWASFGKQMKDFASGSQVLGTKLDLNAFTATELVLSKLPQLIVFDDLERALMPVRTVMGLINRFVEHQGKHVVILANESAIREDEARAAQYGPEKEKLIGRSLRVVPNVNQALIAILGAVSDPCRAFLRDQTGAIEEVFEMSQIENLRLLRQAVVEFSGLYGTLTQQVTQNGQGMGEFLRCYLALSFEFLSGRLTLGDLSARDEPLRYGWGERTDEEGQPPLGVAHYRYQGINIHPERSVISVQAGLSIIGRSQLPNWLSDDLLAKKAFTSPATPDGRPDWITLWRWQTLPCTQLEQLIARVHASLLSGEITELGEMIHIYRAYTWFKKHGVVPDDVDPVPWFRRLIAENAKLGKIPPREPGRGRTGDGYGYRVEDGRFRYGGHSFDVEEDDMLVIDDMRAAQDAALAVNLPDYTKVFCALLRDDPDEILTRFRGESRGDFWWNRSAVLNFTDANAVMDTLVSVWCDEPRVCTDLMDAIANRQIVGSRMRDEERPWLLVARPLMIEKAQAVSKYLGAQVQACLKRTWDRELTGELP